RSRAAVSNCWRRANDETFEALPPALSHDVFPAEAFPAEAFPLDAFGTTTRNSVPVALPDSFADAPDALPAVVPPSVSLLPDVVPPVSPPVPLSEPLGAGRYVPFRNTTEELFAIEVVNRADSLTVETLPLPPATLRVHCVPPAEIVCP